MHPAITKSIAILAAIPIAACADPAGPGVTIHDPTAYARLARERTADPITVPDSVGIPRSIPPVYEEAPAGIAAPE